VRCEALAFLRTGLEKFTRTEMDNRLIGLHFKKAERKHLEAFQEMGRAINEKVNLYAQIGRALIAAREAGADAYQAIEAVLEWDAFRLSVQEAATLARPHDFDYLESFGAAYPQFRRYIPQFLDTFEFRASPACAELLRAVDLLQELNETAARRVPDDAPIGFIRAAGSRTCSKPRASIDAFTNCAC
jgi:hypothetical protein